MSNVDRIIFRIKSIRNTNELKQIHRAVIDQYKEVTGRSLPPLPPAQIIKPARKKIDFFKLSIVFFMFAIMLFIADLYGFGYSAIYYEIKKLNPNYATTTPYPSGITFPDGYEPKLVTPPPPPTRIPIPTIPLIRFPEQPN